MRRKYSHLDVPNTSIVTKGFTTGEKKSTSFSMILLTLKILIPFFESPL
uniref:Uncharacterized protein n=1 Tax=Utricularia reniformis TaxID=192314 RepID=A0A1Y0B236_9LAMI|nr:hypothetical protein AEK19_MT1299 [Utricularia reniformis]ART31502.1 hypothetical protein AEK19_MT1299 [Utricularia reniformis]